jgi:hypothetical protein
MNQPAEKREIFEIYSQINVHFHVCPIQPCIDVKAALDSLASLPGCIDYTLTHWTRSAFQWTIAGVWANEEERNRHYCSDQIQVLFNCLIRQRASVICCSEGQKLHPKAQSVQPLHTREDKKHEPRNAL